MRLAAVAALSVAGATASCSSADDAGHEFDASDAGDDTSDQADAGVIDASRAPDVRGPFDGGRRTVNCESATCATALVTTRGADATDIAEGFCALLVDKSVACWGGGAAGQLGRGPEWGGADSATPARVAGVANIVALDHTCALDETGSAFCWGTGPYLRSPSEATTTEPSPVKLDIPTATKLSVGPVAGCALTSGNVACWGANLNGQVASFKTDLPGAILPVRTVLLPPGATVEELVVGNAVFAVRTDRTVVSWGANPPLGRVSSLFPDPNPLPIGLTDVMALDVSDDQACATSQGVGYCWGSPVRLPEWENNTPNVERALPTPVVTPEPIVQIATPPTELTGRWNDEVVPRRWCAAGVSGEVYCWGYNTSGQAGDGTKQHAYEAVKVVGLPGPVSEVKVTTNTTCALLTSGKVYCWGANYYGQLGNGELKRPSAVPHEVVLP